MTMRFSARGGTPLVAQPVHSQVRSELGKRATVSDLQTPTPSEPDRDPDPGPGRGRDDTPDTPPTEPPPVPVQDPPAEPGPGGPYVVK